MDLLRIVLRFNYCTFDSRTFWQKIGFATGVSCGTQVADVFLEMLFRPVFTQYREYITVLKRFVDDGWLIWRGPAATAVEMFDTLNAACDDISLTYEISETSSVFLDLNIFKGPLWRHTGLLDSSTHAKEISWALYVPAQSEHPVHCMWGIVVNELCWHIKRCSVVVDYVA